MFTEFYLNIELFHPKAVMPKRAITGDAGLDLFVCEETELPPDILISAHTGIKIEFPAGYAAIIKEKSGLALKEIEIKAGVIDHEYRGEVIVLARNKSKDIISLSPGQKIAQMIVVPVWIGGPKLVEKVNEDTDRKNGGFGSTGV
ncbi:MAG: dUTP diphosphatase [bacterium]|jgi:dUTP pyrophosphatase